MLILFCISLIFGAALFFSFDFSILEVSIVSVLWGALFCFVLKNKRAAILGLALGVTVLLGAIRVWMIPVVEPPLGNQAFVGVIKSVDERLDKTLLKVRIKDTNTNIQVTIREKQNFLPGDTVSVRGKVELPEDFVTDTGRIFDYDSYLSSRGVDAVVGFAQVVRIKQTNFSINKIATQIRNFIAETLAENINFPVDGIVASMLVGFQGAIPKYLSEIFRDTGTLHTLVLSGYNITVLAGFLGLLFRRLPFKIKTVLIALGIGTLVLISGSGVAATRAGIMGCIALFSGMSLQSYSALRALFLSILFFFFLNPKTIFVDPGFHLSFLATLFIVTILPILKERFIFIPNGKFNLRELIILAVGLPIFMLPYMMYFSGFFPLVSPLANIFLAPIIPVLMLGGVVVVSLSFLPFVSSVLGFIVSFIGYVAINMLTFFANFPQWQTPTLPPWCVVIFYFILFATIFRKEIVIYFAHLRNIFQQQSS
jgi:ComEC/Rec2-related protein